jgi:tRNA wybutosine-synthesizing protein 3
MQALPSPPASFLGKKTKILQQLAVPDSEYADASPKGSVDVGIRDLIAEINEFEGLVTTSSCAGRVSVFLEGRKHAEAGDDERLAQTTTAGVGGKGGGGAWLFVSHDPVTKGDETWMNSLELLYPEEAQKEASEFQGERRLIHFKFEPMVRDRETSMTSFMLEKPVKLICECFRFFTFCRHLPPTLNLSYAVLYKLDFENQVL